MESICVVSKLHELKWYNYLEVFKIFIFFVIIIFILINYTNE